MNEIDAETVSRYDKAYTQNEGDLNEMCIRDSCMDADLQHPLECVQEILDRFEEGYEVINMVRTKNKTAGLIKNFTSAAFYSLINRVSDVHFEPNASDFFALTADAARVLRENYREKVRFLRGYVQNIGFKRTTIQYEARPRFAGESKYSIRSLMKFSINTILCFSDLPLKLGIYSGVGVAFLGLLVMIYTIWTLSLIHISSSATAMR